MDEAQIKATKVEGDTAQAIAMTSVRAAQMALIVTEKYALATMARALAIIAYEWKVPNEALHNEVQMQLDQIKSEQAMAELATGHGGGMA